MIQSMFHMELPLLEKIVRPIIVYLALIFFLRLFGKRELAQLNPFDLVVLLSLSNTVQNAMIGNDNSVSGGIIGAFSLLAVNWVLMRILYANPKLNAAFEGKSSTLITNGKPDKAEMKREGLTEEELLSVLHKQSFDTFDQVKLCVLEPNGTFYIEGITPSSSDRNISDLMKAVEKLTGDLQELRTELKVRQA